MKQNNWRFELYSEDDRVKHEKYLSEQPYNKELDDLLVEFGRKERAVQRQDNRWRSIFELKNKSSDLCSPEERVINDISKQLIRKCVEMLPAVMQNEIHPYYQENEVIPCIQEQEIVVEGWYPLGGRGHTAELLGDEIILAIAEAYGVSSAQVILRWNLQKGVVVIPGSSNPDHIRENLQLFDFLLTDDEMQQINALDRGEKHDWY